MTLRLAAFIIGAFMTIAVHAGHGFMNAFADVEWLPDPGYTPDQAVYPLDRMGEQTELALVDSGDDAMARCLEFAREKLAEASAMIKAGDADSASLAVRLYDDYIGRAAASVEVEPVLEVSRRRQRYVNALLEHVYIMSVDYLDMPLGIRRTALSPLFATAMQHFEAQRAMLSKGEQDALFFKEEEIRWSLEMTDRADEQGITN